MQALELNLFDFLSKAKKITIVPFHRGFCGDLFDAQLFYKSILKENFIGILSLKKIAENEYILVDGYSRLLMFSLLLCAINNNNMNYEEFLNQLQKSNSQNIKIEFLPNDNIFYKAVSTNYFDELKTCPQTISEIYNFFLEKTSLTKRKTNNLLKKIFNVKAIFMILEDDKISLSHLYTGMNSQHRQIDEYDEIKSIAYEYCRNEHIFNNYFLRFEREYTNQNCENLIMPFIKDYLTIQNNGAIPQNGQYAVNFKTFLVNITKIRNIGLVFSDFYRYSKYYMQIVNETVSDVQIKSELSHINSQGATDAYPYLMEVFEDWDNNNITKDMLLDILKMINMFIEQRKSPEASKFVMTFAKLSSKINKMLALRDYTPKICEEMTLTINKISNN